MTYRVIVTAAAMIFVGCDQLEQASEGIEQAQKQMGQAQELASGKRASPPLDLLLSKGHSKTSIKANLRPATLPERQRPGSFSRLLSSVLQGFCHLETGSVELRS